MIFKKKGKYHATHETLTLAWNDIGQYQLYNKQQYIESGSKEECLIAARKEVEKIVKSS